MTDETRAALRGEIERAWSATGATWFTGDLSEIVKEIAPGRLYGVRLTWNQRGKEVHHGFALPFGYSAAGTTLEEALLRAMVEQLRRETERESQMNEWVWRLP